MVSAIGSLLIVLGVVAVIVGSITFIIAAFRTSILWGIGTLIFGPVGLAYLILHWSEAKKPFFMQLWGFAFIIIANLAFHAQLPWQPN